MKRRTKGEGSIYQRKDGLWVAQLNLPTGKKKVKYSRTQKEVKDWLIEQRKALFDGVLVSPTKVTVEQFLFRWMEDIKAPTLRPSTLISHESIIRNHINPDIGSIKLVQLTPAHLQNLYSQKLKSGLSKRTVKYIHTIMHQMLDQALKWGLVVRNVADAVDAPQPVRKPVEPLTQSQVQLLLEVLKEDRLFPLYVVYLGCGLRRGEALALTTDCIDFDLGVIYIKKTLQSIRGQGVVVGEPKSDTSRRTVAMPEFVMEVLRSHLDRSMESEYVFCTSNGTPFIPRNIVRHFKRMLKKAGLPENIRIHDLRHTFVSFMLAQNVPPKDVQVIAGHADFSTTMDIYGHLMPGADYEAARKMNKIFH